MAQDPTAPAPTAHEWLAAFAEAVGADPPDDATRDTLLELAAVAAHASERLAAPLACWMVGRGGADPADALEAARRLAP